MYKFKIDENLPVEAANVLAEAGHDAETVHAEQLSGHPDAEIAAKCLQERRVIVTLDLDFSDIRSYPPADYPGIIVLRLVSQGKVQVLLVLERLLSLLEREELTHKLWVVDETNARIRG